MDSEVQAVKYGRQTIEYQLVYANRKTLEIAVHPDTKIVVKAPNGSNKQLIKEKVRKKARWIFKQILYFSQFIPKTPARQYINGETHLYLGRRYRLRIKKGDDNRVKLKRGYFEVETCNCEDARGILEGWYLKKARLKFTELFENRWANFKAKTSDKPNLKIRKMEKRWGSLSKNLTLTLNPELIKAPKECVDYVIVHELCHLIHQNHNSEFYRLLEDELPDWERRKYRLELALI